MAIQLDYARDENGGRGHTAFGRIVGWVILLGGIFFAYLLLNWFFWFPITVIQR